VCWHFREVDDLERSHAYLTDLVERQGIPVFSEMDAALKCTAKAIQQVEPLYHTSVINHFSFLKKKPTSTINNNNFFASFIFQTSNP